MNYQISIRIPLEAVDDIAARQKYKKMIEEMSIPQNSKIKLQRVYDDKEPEGLKI